MGYHNPGLPGKLDPGWWLTYPSEKYESQLGVLFLIYGKIKAMFQTTKQDILNLPKGEMGTTSYPAPVANSGPS